ncbi:phage portal protein [Halobacillus karajensis]|uniref:phage portal protein n=1 Tax=Halobacillus karajensis TaxID=195088 RepID=UPI00045C83BC|nr:phage portal protein [Halobacillus karajensis]CDQ21697.1 phage portal protein, SPP1 family [Halobacillus karajensis]
MHRLFKKGEFFPHPDHEERINRYKQNRKLFLGEHKDVFNKHGYKLKHNQKNLLYLSVNLASIICKKSSDFLFSESPTVSAGRGDNSKEQQALDRLTEDNHMNITNYESALANAYRGDSFYKVRIGQEMHGELPPEIDPYKVIIEAQNAEYVFPETFPSDDNKVRAYHVAVPERIDDGAEMPEDGKYVLNVESHYAGRIEYSQFQLIPIEIEPDGEITTYKIGYEYTDQRHAIATGVNYPLIVHVANTALDDSWQGIDDLTEHKPILDEINNRLSQISEILDQHADAPIIVPTGTLREDANGNLVYNVAQEKVFEVDGKEDVLPQYVTNSNAMVEHAFTELEKLIDLLFTVTEIPSVALGRNDSGTSGSSGLSIKFRMNSLISKINRKRQYYDKGLKRVYVIAQMLENAIGIDNYQVSVPKIKFKDGLPKDEMEQANIYAVRTGGKPTLSQKTAIRELDDLTEEQVEQELERMEDEEPDDEPVDGSIFNEEEEIEGEEEAPEEDAEE